MMTILLNLHVTMFTCCPLKMTAGGCPFFAMARTVLARQLFTQMSSVGFSPRSLKT